MVKELGCLFEHLNLVKAVGGHDPVGNDHIG